MKVVAIASGGGHWIQLQRVVPAFAGHEVSYISTHPSFAATVPGHAFYAVPDASRWNKLKLLKVGYELFRLISRIKPDVIISTGAAPGLMAMLAGKLTGARTIWLDSIANIEHLSMSGRIALRFADRIYTQWPKLATDKVEYAGNVLS